MFKVFRNIYNKYQTVYLYNKKRKDNIIESNDLDHLNKSNNFVIKNFSIYNYQKNKYIIKDINLNIKKNQITTLIGPSGCGKSSLLHSLNKTIITDNVSFSGNIYLNGESIFRKNLINEELRTKVGMVFQKPILFPFSIKKNITLALELNGITDPEELNKIVKSSLKSAGLWSEVKNDLDSPCDFLSGGQQQKLAIARTISLKPEIILMDEPTSALDPISSAKIEELIIELSKEYTIIFASHSMSQVRRIGHYTAFMQKGKIVEFNTTRRIFTQPTKRITSDYINSEY